MALGLGHQYWVHVITHYHGTLQECLKYALDHPPKSSKTWYELHPDVKGFKEKSLYVDEYSIDLVEGDFHK